MNYEYDILLNIWECPKFNEENSAWKLVLFCIFLSAYENDLFSRKLQFLGLTNLFDISIVFEIALFEISKFNCSKLNECMLMRIDIPFLKDLELYTHFRCSIIMCTLSVHVHVFSLFINNCFFWRQLITLVWTLYWSTSWSTASSSPWYRYHCNSTLLYFLWRKMVVSYFISYFHMAQNTLLSSSCFITVV